MSRKTGAMLMRCLFCGARQVLLEWIDGRGWCCPVCETGMEGTKNGRPATRET